MKFTVALIIVTGALFVYAGVNRKTLTQTLQELVQGKLRSQPPATIEPALATPSTAPRTVVST